MAKLIDRLKLSGFFFLFTLCTEMHSRKVTVSNSSRPNVIQNLMRMTATAEILASFYFFHAKDFTDPYQVRDFILF